MVPRCPCTATVWSRPCTVHWWLSLSIGANQQSKMYGKVAHRTVAVPCSGCTRTQMIINGLLDHDQSWSNCCDEAVDCFMLLSWWCTFKMKKVKWPTRQFKIIYLLVPLSTPVCCRWTVHLNTKLIRNQQETVRYIMERSITLIYYLKLST